MKYKENKRNLNIDVRFEIIHESIAEYFGAEMESVFLTSRVQEVAILRQWFHYFATILNPNISKAYIGAYYSNKSGRKYDHSTVLHSRKVIDGYIDVSKFYRSTKFDITSIIREKMRKYENKLTGNCAEQPFKINRYYENRNKESLPM